MSVGLPARDVGPHPADVEGCDEEALRVPSTGGGDDSWEGGNEELTAAHGQTIHDQGKPLSLDQTLDDLAERRKEGNRLAQRAFREKQRKRLKDLEENALKLEQEEREGSAEGEQLGTQNQQFEKELEDQREFASAASFNKSQTLPVPRALLTESDKYDPSSISIELGFGDEKKNYVFVNEHSHHQRLKVMRECEGCRRRKIKCDAATTNQWPCAACVRLKLHCVPPASKTGAVQDDHIQFQAYPSNINNKVKETVPLTSPGTSAGTSPAFGRVASGMSPMKLVSYKEKTNLHNQMFVEKVAPNTVATSKSRARGTEETEESEINVQKTEVPGTEVQRTDMQRLEPKLKIESARDDAKSFASENGNIFEWNNYNLFASEPPVQWLSLSKESRLALLDRLRTLQSQSLLREQTGQPWGRWHQTSLARRLGRISHSKVIDQSNFLSVLRIENLSGGRLQELGFSIDFGPGITAQDTSYATTPSRETCVRELSNQKYGKTGCLVLPQIRFITKQDLEDFEIPLFVAYVRSFIRRVIAGLKHLEPAPRELILGLERLELTLRTKAINDDQGSGLPGLPAQDIVYYEMAIGHAPDHDRGFVKSHASSTDSITSFRRHIDTVFRKRILSLFSQGPSYGSMPFNRQDFGQNNRNYLSIAKQTHDVVNYPFLESAMVSSRDSMEQRDHDLIPEGKDQLFKLGPDTKEHAASVIEKKVAAEALKKSETEYRLEKTSGHVRHHSSDMKIEESEEETEGFLNSQNAVSAEVNNFVLTLNALAVLSLIFAISIANADDISFVICLHWLHCASRIAQVYCQGLGGLNRSWIKDPVFNDSEHDEFNEAISLILSECAVGVSLLYGWSLLPTLLLGCTSFFSTSFSSTGSEHQTTIRRFGRPWNALWCFLGWSLMVFCIPQTTIITSKGMVTILPKSRRRALDQFGYLLGDLQWSDVNPMSIGRSLKLRCEQLLQVLNMQPQTSGKRRVRGQCRCGYRFVDEFTEVRPAAAAYYENLLQKRSSHSKDYPSPANPDQGIQDATNAVDTNAQSKRSTAMSSIAGGLTTFITFAFSLLGKRRNGPTLPQYQLETRGNQPQRSSVCNNELLYLLLCIPQHQFATRLLQPQISDITSDQGFFLLLRRNYRQMRGRMRRIFSMRTIRSIKFVQFEMYKSELVDIRKLDDLPPEDKKDEYRYNPVPADLIPPVGENHMLHLINHPTHAEADGFVLDRIPKKLKERLLVSPSRGTGLGWGIYFIEGWHVSAITLVAFAVLLAGSLVFLVCWSVLEHDLQGASGVAAYMVAFLGLAIGSIQAVFELT